jgi:hypothetical protein
MDGRVHTLPHFEPEKIFDSWWKSCLISIRKRNDKGWRCGSHLPGKCNALSSNPRASKKEKKKREKW